MPYIAIRAAINITVMLKLILTKLSALASTYPIKAISNPTMRNIASKYYKCQRTQ